MNKTNIIKIDKYWIKTFFLMLFSVIMMGFGVSLLVLTKMGTDPCSSMNYGMARTLGLSFGTYQLCFNAILLLMVILTNWRMIGMGTLGNMVMVGYSADFFSWIWNDICHIPTDLSLGTRILILIPALLVFVVAAACYMNSDHGMAPYDAMSFILCDKIEKLLKKENLFKPVRFVIDFVAMCIGWFTGGEAGILTAFIVVLLAPAVELVGKQFRKMGIGKR